MHRSGTSLAADVLVRLGVHLGPAEEALATAPREHYGYWEDSAVVNLNHDVLLAMGGASWAPPPLSPGWERAAKLDDLVERGRHLVRERFATAERWGFKGPMTSLTLPFWWRVVGKLTYIVCVRSPSDCAASLVARDPSGPLGRADWGALWVHYYALLLQYLRGKRATWLFFEDWDRRGPEHVSALARLAGGDDRPEEDLVRAGTAFTPELQHHSATGSAVAGDESVPAEATALWLAMRSIHGDVAAEPGAEVGLPDLALRLWRNVDPLAAGAWAPHVRNARPSARAPRVSVVLPVRNPDPAELRRTVATATGQDLHDLELLVVDDGSWNGSVDGVAHVDWRIRVIRHRFPRGLAAARRTGRRAAAGALLVDLSLGDRWQRDTLRKLAARAGGNVPDAAVRSV